MQRFPSRLMAHFFVLTIAGTLSVAQEFKQYPGSRLDDKASQQATALEKGTDVQVFTSSDNFENIYTFYKTLYAEVAVPFPKQSLPSGKEVNWAFFVLDGAKDIVHSNCWMKVQRPYIGSVDDEANFQDVRDLSVIEIVRRRGPAFKKNRLFDISDRPLNPLRGGSQRPTVSDRSSSSRRFS